MTEKEELLKLLKENRDEMNQLQSELRTISSRLYDAIRNYTSIETGIKRVLNTEEHGNCHLICKYYNKDSDTCYNYLMGVYTGLAFEVSRLDKCIADVIKEHENRGDVE